MYDCKGPYHALPAYAAALAQDLVAATQQAVQSADLQQRRRTITSTIDSTASSQSSADGAQEHVKAGEHRPLCACKARDVQNSSETLMSGQQRLQVRLKQLPESSFPQPAPPQAQRPIACLQQQIDTLGGSQQAAAPAQPAQKSHDPLLWRLHMPHNAARAFSPDAALVCFYRAGDTLCGHRDDVERDLQQV